MQVSAMSAQQIDRIRIPARGLRASASPEVKSALGPHYPKIDKQPTKHHGSACEC
jgi:hypothetical protein